jgi:hypothetical protein
MWSASAPFGGQPGLSRHVRSAPWVAKVGRSSTRFTPPSRPGRKTCSTRCRPPARSSATVPAIAGPTLAIGSPLPQGLEPRRCSSSATTRWRCSVTSALHQASRRSANCTGAHGACRSRGASSWPFRTSCESTVSICPRRAAHRPASHGGCWALLQTCSVWRATLTSLALTCRDLWKRAAPRRRAPTVV